MPRKSKKELFRSPHRLPLESVTDVRREMCRLYRGGLNGRVSPAVMTRFTYTLEKIRSCLEAEAAIAAANAAGSTPEQPTTFAIIPVPHDYFVRSVEGLSTSIGPLTLEHLPSEPFSNPSLENFDRTQAIETQISELDDLSLEELKQKARELVGQG